MSDVTMKQSQQAMTEALDCMFKFAVGDQVVLAALVEQWRLEAELNPVSPLQALRAPPSGIIVARLAEQCPGGVQLHYRISGIGLPNDMALEHELVPFSVLAKMQRARRQEK